LNLELSQSFYNFLLYGNKAYLFSSDLETYFTVGFFSWSYADPTGSTRKLVRCYRKL